MMRKALYALLCVFLYATSTAIFSAQVEQVTWSLPLQNCRVVYVAPYLLCKQNKCICVYNLETKASHILKFEQEVFSFTVNVQVNEISIWFCQSDEDDSAYFSQGVYDLCTGQVLFKGGASCQLDERGHECDVSLLYNRTLDVAVCKLTNRLVLAFDVATGNYKVFLFIASVSAINISEKQIQVTCFNKEKCLFVLDQNFSSSLKLSPCRSYTAVRPVNYDNVFVLKNSIGDRKMYDGIVHHSRKSVVLFDFFEHSAEDEKYFLVGFGKENILIDLETQKLLKLSICKISNNGQYYGLSANNKYNKAFVVDMATKRVLFSCKKSLKANVLGGAILSDGQLLYPSSWSNITALDFYVGKKCSYVYITFAKDGATLLVDLLYNNIICEDEIKKDDENKKFAVVSDTKVLIFDNYNKTFLATLSWYDSLVDFSFCAEDTMRLIIKDFCEFTYKKGRATHKLNVYKQQRHIIKGEFEDMCTILQQEEKKDIYILFPKKKKSIVGCKRNRDDDHLQRVFRFFEGDCVPGAPVIKDMGSGGRSKRQKNKI